ncbi:MAG: hypothetical protein ACR2IF_01965 [Terriglobales bacterium]
MAEDWFDGLWIFPLLIGVGYAIVVWFLSDYDLLQFPWLRRILRVRATVVACACVGFSLIIAGLRYHAVDPGPSDFYAISGLVALVLSVWLYRNRGRCEDPETEEESRPHEKPRLEL